MANDNDDSLVGQLLAERYALSRLIGRGGMASVYQAWDTTLERFVAVKMFSLGTASNDARRQSEVKLLARVNHPNLVTLHDAHLAPTGSGAPSYLVMELIEGPDLGARLLQGAVPLDEAASLMAELADALTAIHDAGVVHRDLKPGNVLLAPTGLSAPTYRAKIGDFGIAHLVGAEPLTTVGTVIGTAAYLSPEQAMGHDATPASDIYSLGLLILESITGKRAFSGTMLEAISARLARDPEIPTSLPAPWVSLLAAMTARLPDDRPAASEVALSARALRSQEVEIALVPPDAVATERMPTATTATEPMLAPTKILPVTPAGQPATAQGATVTAGDSPTIAMAAPVRSNPRASSKRGGVIAAILTLAAAIAIAIAVGANSLSGSGPGTGTSKDPAPKGSVATTSQTTSTPHPSVTPKPTVTPTPTPSATTPTPPGQGNGKGKGHKPPKPHKP